MGFYFFLLPVIVIFVAVRLVLLLSFQPLLFAPSAFRKSPPSVAVLPFLLVFLNSLFLVVFSLSLSFFLFLSLLRLNHHLDQNHCRRLLRGKRGGGGRLKGKKRPKPLSTSSRLSLCLSLSPRLYPLSFFSLHSPSKQTCRA